MTAHYGPDDEAVTRFAADLKAQLDEIRERRGTGPSPRSRPDPNFVRSVIDRPVTIAGYDMPESPNDFLGVDRTVSRQTLHPETFGYRRDELLDPDNDDDGDDAA